MRPHALLAHFITIVVSVALSAAVVMAWSGPTGTAPANNVAAPLNVGTSDQVKNAGLAINSLAVFGNAMFSGNATTYLNFGSTAGNSGYGIRDNNGTLEFKNSDGTWTPIPISVGITQATTTSCDVPPSGGGFTPTSCDVLLSFRILPHRMSRR